MENTCKWPAASATIQIRGQFIAPGGRYTMTQENK